MRIFFVIILFPFTLLSQNTLRFSFKYDFAADPAKKDSLLTNYMDLDTNGSESHFYNVVKFKTDSIKKSGADMLAMFKAGKMDKSLNFSITKNYGKKEVTYYTRFTTIDFRIPETEIPIWKLTGETKTVGKWNCQKAQTHYKGREWIAYFTTEIPINDGPYKFWGLPGFIVEIFDEEHLHKFSLIEVKKIEKPYLLEIPKNVKTITYGQLLAYQKNYMPSVSDVAGVQVNNGTSTYIMKDGSRANIYISKETLDKYRNNQDAVGKIITQQIGGQVANPIEKQP